MPESYFPLLALNRSQSCDSSVLSSDGKNELESVPNGGVLYEYSQKEVWIWVQAAISTGHGTLIETIETAVENVHQARDLLRSYRKRATRAGEDEAPYHDLPAPDRRPIRQAHLVLQVVLSADLIGLETGFHDFFCGSCGGSFLINLASSRLDPGNTPERRLGFDDVDRFIRIGFVKCPVCGALTYPKFRW